MKLDLSGRRAVVVGNGNVALDVARILVSDPDELRSTDIADHALALLDPRGIDEVIVLGRRGALQATFTSPELRELGDLKALDDVDVIIDADQLASITDADVEAAGKSPKSNIKVLRSYVGAEQHSDHRRIVFRFATSPIELRGNGRVEEIVLGRNELVTDDNGRVSARDTGEREVLPVDLVVRAVGYRGVPTPGLPFDEKTGTIPHTDGRIDGTANQYVVGWIKRGPSGVIGSNKSDSAATVDTLAAGLAAAQPRAVGPGYDAELADWLLSRQPALITDEHWQLIDAHERSTGAPTGRPRVKLSTVADLLQVGHG